VDEIGLGGASELAGFGDDEIGGLAAEFGGVGAFEVTGVAGDGDAAAVGVETPVPGGDTLGVLGVFVALGDSAPGFAEPVCEGVAPEDGFGDLGAFGVAGNAAAGEDGAAPGGGGVAPTAPTEPMVSLIPIQLDRISLAWVNRSWSRRVYFWC
jgi:hypothetical protein